MCDNFNDYFDQLNFILLSKRGKAKDTFSALFELFPADLLVLVPKWVVKMKYQILFDQSFYVSGYKFNRHNQ